MRLKIPFIVAFTFFVLLLVVVSESVSATIPFDGGSLEKVSGAADLSHAAQISATVSPTATGSTTLAPTPTITATVVSSPTLTPTPVLTVGQSTVIYLPALVDAPAGGAGGQSEPCGPTSLSSSPLGIEPTSTPAPLATPTPLATPISQTIGITQSTYIVSSTVCPPNVHELTLAELIINSPLQQRTVMTYNPVLAQVAKNHAMDMAVRGFFGPTDPTGIGPNRRAERAGYLLPDYYGQTLDANNIETTMAGYATAEEVWQVFVDSSGSDHVWGRNSGYVAQYEYGIGYAYVEESEHERYWVILIAKQREETQ